MCLAIPGEIVQIEGHQAEVSFSGARRRVDLRLVEGAKVGDYVLVHAGCAIQVIPPGDAEEILKLLAEIDEEPYEPKQ
ncbi:MAG TPA: HypC/HybG/HupF family hydrogenase formation chaperone [Bacillota bacterium]|nr:HypC/HybG/HupF family hydrogenase formation chaperone [Bacillota bacterium]